MSENGQLLLQRLQESGFEIELPKESEYYMDHVRAAFTDLPDYRKTQSEFEDAVLKMQDGSGSNMRSQSVIIVLAWGFLTWLGYVTGTSGLIWFASVALSMLPLLVLAVTCQDVWIRGLWRNLRAKSSRHDITKEEVIKLLSRQLQERQERVLGIDLQDTLDQLRTDKQELENIRNQLEAKEESAHEQDMAGVWQEEMDHLDADIREYEMAIENIKSHLKQVRKLSAEIAEELLPSYREQEELANLLEKSVEARGDTKENIRGAYRALELSQQTLADRLGTIERLVNQAKQVSANLHQFIDEDDRKPERLREETETLDISVEGLESGEQETADTKMRAHA